MANAIEIGKVEAGTHEFSTTVGRRMFRPLIISKSDNVGVRHKAYNASEKTIKYVTFVYLAYNRVNDPITCTISGKTEARGEITGPIEPNVAFDVEWENLWYNPTVDKAVIKEVIVQYMDNSEEVINGADLQYIDSEDSVYYEKRGRQEKAAAEERERKKKAAEEQRKADEAERAKKAEAERIEKEKKQAEINKKNSYKFAYIFFLPLLQIGKAKEDDTLKFHTNQGIWLFIIEVLAMIVSGIPYVGFFISVALLAVAIVFAVKGIKSVDKGEQKEIPLLGKIRFIK